MNIVNGDEFGSTSVIGNSSGPKITSSVPSKSFLTPKKLAFKPILRKSPRLINKAIEKEKASCKRMIDLDNVKEPEMLIFDSQESVRENVAAGSYKGKEKATLDDENGDEFSNSGDAGEEDYGEESEDYYGDLLVSESEKGEEEKDNVPPHNSFSLLDYPELIDLVGTESDADKDHVNVPESINGPEMTSVADRRTNEHLYADYVNVFGEGDSEDEPLFPEEEDVVNVLDSGSMEVGLEFPDKSAFSKHLRAYAVLNGFQFRVKKSDPERMRVVCAHHETEDCNFFVYATKEKGDDHTFIIRGLNLVHSCEGDPLGRNRSANSAFVAAHVMNNLAGGRVIPNAVEIVDEFWRSHNTLLPYHTAWRARVMVLERLHGSYDESYKFVPSLCEMVSRTNPVRGFKDGCRKVFGLDGCHLSGKHGGWLLSATGLDVQNGLVPLGIFICRNECYENWHLFLKNLKPKIIGQGFTLNFISDRQKGLVEAVHKLFPDSPHRFCFRVLSLRNMSLML